MHTLRYYEKEGLLPAISKNVSGHRQYSQSDAERLWFIKRAQRMNFTLSEIRQLIAVESSVGHDKVEARKLVTTKLADIEASLNDLKKLKTELSFLLSTCLQSGDDDACPIIDEIKKKPANS